MPQRVLAVGHDAFRAGAQLLLLHVLAWLRDNDDREFDLVLTGDGDLLEEYRAVVPTRVLAPRIAPGSSSRVLAAIRSARHRRVLAQERLAPGSYDLVYANTIATAPIAVELGAQARCPVVCHVHELEMSMRWSTSPEVFARVHPDIDRFIVVSGAVEANLVENHGVDPSRIDRVPAAVRSTPRSVPDEQVAEARSSLGIPDDAFVVGGCGTLDWRKGPDVFVQVARALQGEMRGRPVHFVWVGGERNELDLVRYDRDRMGLADVVHLVGEQADPAPWFSMFDVFLLTSREDPYPLVCLEAAQRATPIVCFAGAGGMPEFVEHDAGVVVPYLDVDAAASSLADLASDEDRRRMLGERAARKVEERCTMDVIGPEIREVLDRVSGRRAVGA